MKILIIMVGIPGTGKSTFAKNINNALICSNDDYFINDDGEYEWKDDELYLAFKQCFNKFINGINEGREIIVIDNTNLNSKSCKKYIKIGKENNYNIIKVIMHGELTEEELIETNKRCVHNISMDTTLMFYKNFLEYNKKINGD